MIIKRYCSKYISMYIPARAVYNHVHAVYNCNVQPCTCSIQPCTYHIYIIVYYNVPSYFIYKGLQCMACSMNNPIHYVVLLSLHCGVHGVYASVWPCGNYNSIIIIIITGGAFCPVHTKLLYLYNTCQDLYSLWTLKSMYAGMFVDDWIQCNMGGESSKSNSLGCINHYTDFKKNVQSSFKYYLQIQCHKNVKVPTVEH